MNELNFHVAPAPADQFSRRVASHLDDASNALPHDITERLRASRVRAVEQHKHLLAERAHPLFTNGATLSRGHGHTRWWSRLGSAGLLLTLVLGLFAINAIQDELGAQELADIDAAILTDDLPPSAYVDAGFAQFLKTNHRAQP